MSTVTTATTMATDDHPALATASRLQSKNTRQPRSPRVTSEPRVREVTRPSGSRVARGAVKISLFLSPEMIKRLKMTALQLSMDTSVVVETMLSESPTYRRFRVSDWGKSDDPAMVEVSST